MSGTTTDTHGRGRRPAVEIIRDSITSSGPLFVRIPTSLRQPLSNFETSLRHAPVLSGSVKEMRVGDDALDHQEFLIQKVLRFCQKGRSSSSQMTRISSGFLSGNSLAVKGDALIHGPSLVARPVGSEWRTRRPYQEKIKIN